MTARTRELEVHGTTILSVRHRGRVVLGGDGQVTVGQTVLKSNARKVRRLYHDRVLAGFAGAGADALTLFERFEAKLQAVNGNLRRAAATSRAISRSTLRGVRRPPARLRNTAPRVTPSPAAAHAAR